MFTIEVIREITMAAEKLGLEPASLLAVAEVESGGKAYARIDGQLEPLIRFEGHYFDRRLSPANRARARAQKLAAPRAGAIPNSVTQLGRWRLLSRAAAIDRHAAYESVSWGIGQVMGAHWDWLGYDNIDALVAEARAGVIGQVRLMARFIEKSGLFKALKAHDWSTFARGYNGPAYAKRGYDKKLAAAHERYKTEVAAGEGALETKALTPNRYVKTDGAGNLDVNGATETANLDSLATAAPGAAGLTIISKSTSSAVGTYLDIPTNLMDFAAGDGLTDDSAALVSALNLGRKVRAPAERYLLSTPAVFPNNNFELVFENGAEIINGMSPGSGTSDALFTISGSGSQHTTLTADCPRNTSVVTPVADASAFAVGDVAAFVGVGSASFSFYAKVVAISGLNLTLDRAPPCDLASGSAVGIIVPMSGWIDGANFNFNGSSASPRYGFGISATYHRGLIVENTIGRNIGSKAIELSRGCDSRILHFRQEGETVAASGVGYAVRISLSNDCLVDDVVGLRVRHVVDFSTAHRNRVRDSKGFNNSGTCFVTHFNGCIGNEFANCEVYDSPSAYSFTPAQGDEDNVVRGGKIVNSTLQSANSATVGTDYKGNRFIGVEMIAQGSRRPITESVDCYDCTIECRSTQAFYDGAGAASIRFHGGTVVSASAGSSIGLGSFSQATTTAGFYGTDFVLRENYRTFAGTTTYTIAFDDCTFEHLDALTGNNSALLFGQFAAALTDCRSRGTVTQVAMSNNTANTLALRNCTMLAASSLAQRLTSSANNIALTVDLPTLMHTAVGTANVNYIGTTTGHTVMSGTALKGAQATYAGQNVSATFVEAEVQAIDDALKALSQKVKSHDDALFTAMTIRS